jgi:DNA primase catalytic core
LHARGSGYLADRGIDVGVLEAHTGRPEVGHTPADPVGLATALQGKGFTPDELVDAGLAHRDPLGAQLADFYRQRVLVPVRDRRGQLVGIVGRNIGHPSFAKYKNPFRTAVYDKSVQLYQPLPAPTSRRGQVVVVEGTLDALAVAVAAIKMGKASEFCPVTQSGRELSDRQVRDIIALFPDAPVLAFDGDAAGRDSAARYVRAFAHYGKTVTVTFLSDDHDPASWLAEEGPRGLSAFSRHEPLSSGRDGPIPGDAESLAVIHTARADDAPRKRTRPLVNVRPVPLPQVSAAAVLTTTTEAVAL